MIRCARQRLKQKFGRTHFRTSAAATGWLSTIAFHAASPRTPETLPTMKMKKRTHDSSFSKSAKSSSSSRKRARNASSSAAVPVSLDQLRWSKVALPDRLDDAEGFFGLEEIDGVEVENIGGKIGYKVLLFSCPGLGAAGRDDSGLIQFGWSSF